MNRTAVTGRPETPRRRRLQPPVCVALASLLSVSALFSTAAPGPASANTLIALARQSGALDEETAQVYEVLDALEPDLLPPQYRARHALQFCGTPALLEASHRRAGLSPDNQRILGKVLQRPLMPESLLTPSGRFRIHYRTTGRDAVDPADTSGNGVPDYVDSVSAVLEHVWRVEIETLGFRAPPADGGAGGGPELDVYLLDLGRLSYYGLTYPESNGATTSTYLQLDNDYTNSVYGQAGYCPPSVGTRGLVALRVTVAHEFFHMVQFGYYQGRDGSWWQEASSTWMEDVAYPDADDYLQYVCAFLGSTSRSLDSGRPLAGDYHPYGASIFAHFLDQRYDRSVVRLIWEELGRRASADMSHFDRVLQGVDDEGLEGAVADFGLWNYFTGTRQHAQFYSEGGKYPEPPALPVSVAPKVAVYDSGAVDHLASAYVSLVPHGGGGVTLDTQLDRGGWQRQLVLAAADSLQILKLGELGPVEVADWEAYEDIVLVITNTESSGLGFGYRVSVEYDPDMSGGDAPLATIVGNAHPNPFHPESDGRVLLPYELQRSAPAARISVFSVDGQLVRLFEDVGTARRAYRHAWDGRNEQGELVGSGIYYWVLEADGQVLTRPLALVRD